MSLKNKIEPTLVSSMVPTAHERWDETKEPLEAFLERELIRLEKEYKGRPLNDRTIDEIKRAITDVIIRADSDPSWYVINVERVGQNGLSLDVRPADMRERAEETERSASGGNIADAYSVLVDATKAVQRAATLMQPFVEMFEDGLLKDRAKHILEAQININDRAVMAVSNLLMAAMEKDGAATKSIMEARGQQEAAKPMFKHDCDKCEFLGQDKDHDLYYCELQMVGPSLVARYGDEGPEYHSLPVRAAITSESSLLPDHPIYLALIAARGAGKVK